MTTDLQMPEPPSKRAVVSVGVGESRDIPGFAVMFQVWRGTNDIGWTRDRIYRVFLIPGNPRAFRDLQPEEFRQQYKTIGRHSAVTEKEFHRQRRMFIVISGTVLVAPAGSELTHFEWLSQMGSRDTTNDWLDIVNDWISRCTRGYVWEDRIAFYVGAFSHRVDQRQVPLVLDVMLKLYPELQTIQFGAVRSPNQPWPGKTEYNLQDYFARIATPPVVKPQEPPDYEP